MWEIIKSLVYNLPRCWLEVQVSVQKLCWNKLHRKICYTKETILLLKQKTFFFLFFYPGTICMRPLVSRHALDRTLFQNLLAYFAEPSIAWSMGGRYAPFWCFCIKFPGSVWESPPLWSLEMQIGKDRKLVQLPSSGTLLPRVSSYYWRQHQLLK